MENNPRPLKKIVIPPQKNINNNTEMKPSLSQFDYFTPWIMK